MSNFAELETAIVGVCLALLCGMDGEARERVTEALESFAADSRTPVSEAQFYRDLAESIGMTAQAPAWGVFEQLATVH